MIQICASCKHFMADAIRAGRGFCRAPALARDVISKTMKKMDGGNCVAWEASQDTPAPIEVVPGEQLYLRLTRLIPQAGRDLTIVIFGVFERAAAQSRISRSTTVGDAFVTCFSSDERVKDLFLNYWGVSRHDTMRVVLAKLTWVTGLKTLGPD